MIISNLKAHKSKLLLGVGYLFLILPIFYCMFYSVPASDDFIYGSRVSSNNIIINALAYVKHLRNNEGTCRWIVFFFQKCINPLNLNIHLGHIYGISVMIVFVVAITIIIYSISFFVGQIVENTRDKDILTFLIAAILLSTYYYSEVYNWYTGGTAYAIPISFLLLTYVTIIRYFKHGKEMKNYILLYVFGIVPSTNEFLCVPIGIFYLIFLINDFKLNTEKKEKIKNCFPLLFYIAMGSTVVFTPGMLVRRGKNNITAPIWRLMLQAVINTIVRIKDVITMHPLAVLLLIVIFYFGVKTKGKAKHNILRWVFVLGIGTIGAILPYCLGKGFTNTYMDVRVYYLLDYLLLMSMAFLVFMFGQNFAQKYDISIDAKSAIRWKIIFLMFAYLMMVPQHDYLKVPQIDIMKNRLLIKESYILWDGILSEIENSDEDNVVITRDKAMEWSPYFLYVGLEPGNVYDQSFESITPVDEIMINVYYKKKSIVLNYSE